MTRPRRAGRRLLTAALAASAAAALAAQTPPRPTQRVAPLRTLGMSLHSEVVLAAPRLLDRRDLILRDGVKVGYRVVEGFSFKVEEGRNLLAGGRAEIEVKAPDGSTRTFTGAIGDQVEGDEIQVKIGLPVPPEMEGPYEAALSVTSRDGAPLFAASYGFGYPRFGRTTSLARVSSGAPIKDAFEAEAIDEDLWRIWRDDPDAASVEQRSGRLWINVTGRVAYNGLASKVEVEERDVVAVCRAGVQSGPGANHPALVHLCGSGEWSPDNWMQVRLDDVEGRSATARIEVSVPPEDRGGDREPVDLPHPARDGYLVKIVCEEAAAHCSAHVRVGSEWRQIGSSFHVPARSTRLEIKTQGFRPRNGSSTVWFDDCRVYPRPESHFVTVALRRADGRAPAVSVARSWPPVFFDADNEQVTDRDVVLKLYTGDGGTLVEESSVGSAVDYALLDLDGAPWDTYPVAAVLRVFVRGRQLGPDHVVESPGVEGLYPDDVYVLTFE